MVIEIIIPWVLYFANCGAWGENRTLYTRIFLVIFLNFFKDRTISLSLFGISGAGARLLLGLTC